jgi:hypothetical protein
MVVAEIFLLKGKKNFAETLNTRTFATPIKKGSCESEIKFFESLEAIALR